MNYILEQANKELYAEATILAERFHEQYELLAVEYNYKTRKESAVAWANVPEKNKSLMIRTCYELLLVDNYKLQPPKVNVYDEENTSVVSRTAAYIRGFLWGGIAVAALVILTK